MGLALRQETLKDKQFGIPLESLQSNFDWIPFLFLDFPFWPYLNLFHGQQLSTPIVENFAILFLFFFRRCVILILSPVKSESRSQTEANRERAELRQSTQANVLTVFSFG